MDQNNNHNSRSFLSLSTLLVFSICFQYLRRVPEFYRYFNFVHAGYLIIVLAIVSIIYLRKLDDRIKLYVISFFIIGHFIFTHLLAKPFFFPTSSWIYFKQVEGLASQGLFLRDPTYNQGYLTVLPYLGEISLGYLLRFISITDPLKIYYIAQSVSALMRLTGALLCFIIIRSLGYSARTGMSSMIIFALSANELQGYILNYTTSMTLALAGFYFILRHYLNTRGRYLWLSLGFFGISLLCNTTWGLWLLFGVCMANLFLLLHSSPAVRRSLVLYNMLALIIAGLIFKFWYVVGTIDPMKSQGIVDYAFTYVFSSSKHLLLLGLIFYLSWIIYK